MSRRRTGRAALAALLGLLLAGTTAAPAGAAQVANPNSCQYSYDTYWRDMGISFGGTPSVPTAEPGDTVTLTGQTITAALPEWLAEYGYGFGLLQAGENEIPTKLWVAVRGVNTVEGVQVSEVETVAHTTISTTSSGLFSHATPITYAVPELPPTTWTAKGGPIEFRQAGSGSLPTLPVGPGGALVTPKGSVYMEATLGFGQLDLDCLPGGFTANGSAYEEIITEPFAAVAAPSFACISAVPASTSVAPVGLELIADRRLPRVHAGAAYAFAPAVRYDLPNAYLASLYTAGLLADGDNAVTLDFTAALEAAGATPARQRATGSAPGAINVKVSGGGGTIVVETANGAELGSGPDLAGTAALGATTWTPSGGAGIGFAAAPPGSLGSLAVPGVGEVVAYGSVYARMTIAPTSGPVAGLSLDCVSAEVGVAGGSPPAYSPLGNRPEGDQGRYVLAGYALDPFATALPEPPASVLPPPPPPPAPPPPPVAPAPPGVEPAAPIAGLRSSGLRLRRGRVAVRLRCAGATECRGTLALRTAGRVRLARGQRKRAVALGRTVSYRVRPGRTATVRVTLGSDGRRLMAARRKLRVRAVLRPQRGRTVTRTLTLRR